MLGEHSARWSGFFIGGVTETSPGRYTMGDGLSHGAALLASKPFIIVSWFPRRSSCYEMPLVEEDTAGDNKMPF